MNFFEVLSVLAIGLSVFTLIFSRTSTVNHLQISNEDAKVYMKKAIRELISACKSRDTQGKVFSYVDPQCMEIMEVYNTVKKGAVEQLVSEVKLRYSDKLQDENFLRESLYEYVKDFCRDNTKDLVKEALTEDVIDEIVNRINRKRFQSQSNMGWAPR